MPKNDVMFLVTYESGHEEWLWIDDRMLPGGDQMAGDTETEPAARVAPPA